MIQEVLLLLLLLQQILLLLPDYLDPKLESFDCLVGRLAVYIYRNSCINSRSMIRAAQL